MTIIVYDGKYLYADRKCYASGEHTYDSVKLKGVNHGNVVLHYAFSGSYADCAIGEKVVESNFDPDVCRWAYERLGHDNLQDMFYGILVESRSHWVKHKVFLVNYAGDKCEMLPDQFIAIGANSKTLLDVERTARHYGEEPVPTEDLIRFAFDGSGLTQKGFIIDRIDLRTNEYEEV